MLNQIVDKLMPYKIIILPTEAYEDNDKEPTCYFPGETKRFLTKKSYQNYINNQLDSLMENNVDEKTCYAVSDVIGINPGFWKIKINEKYKELFPSLF